MHGERELPRPRQLNDKLSQTARKHMQVERKKLRPRYVAKRQAEEADARESCQGPGS